MLRATGIDSDCSIYLAVNALWHHQDSRFKIQEFLLSLDIHMSINEIFFATPVHKASALHTQTADTSCIFSLFPDVSILF